MALLAPAPCKLDDFKLNRIGFVCGGGVGCCCCCWCWACCWAPAWPATVRPTSAVRAEPPGAAPATAVLSVGATGGVAPEAAAATAATTWAGGGGGRGGTGPGCCWPTEPDAAVMKEVVAELPKFADGVVCNRPAPDWPPAWLDWATEPVAWCCCGPPLVAAAAVAAEADCIIE